MATETKSKTTIASKHIQNSNKHKKQLFRNQIVYGHSYIINIITEKSTYSTAAKGNNSKGSCILVQKRKNWHECKKVGIFHF
jgi:hypothetical protein